MAGDSAKKGPGLGLLALVAGFFFLRSNSAQGGGVVVPVAGNTPAPSPGSGSSGSAASSGGGGASTFATVANYAKAAAPYVEKAAPVAGAFGTALGAGGGASAIGLGFAAVGLEVGGAALGYAQGGVPGAIIGALNPVTGNGALAGFNLGKGLAKDAGANDAGQDAAGASGAILGGLITLGEFTTALALLPTLGLVTALADLVGAALGLGSGSDVAQATPQQQVDALFALAAGTSGAISALPPSEGNDLRIQAAEQLAAWANGPATYTVGAYTFANPLRTPARARAFQLGLGPAITN